MKKSLAVLVTVGVAATALVLAMAVVPGFGPRTLLNPVIEAFGGVTCDDQRCPPDAPWVWPVDAPVTSEFRSESRPDHHGIDIAADPGTPIFAASAGVVSIADCQASLHGEPYSCDQDGSWEVRGCGWYVKVLHADRVATLYCHLLEQPEVEVGDAVETGDLLGYVGSSGNSSGPHLHFEVQQGRLFVPPVSANAVDPEPFLAERVDDAPAR
ncbi:M23 family metallopeptidase [Natronosporangium hydrolyticum]|uniref:M23 family metallopeptidase n=1 Tax=Natronosporangium hydrolyticum TaxID=2811111 RepID=A0A895YGJ3_9ACTN|nr:M23 family metallopeptidase [Natronosporangium hydrolyticum]QSB15212.1 M23 family metallopeptidase [Natronosporangium hydrolyticum]